MPKDDRYEVTTLLGRGGFGEVRRVIDRHLCREAAQKVLRPDLRDRPAEQATFLAEARLTAQLRHPGIVALYDLHEGPELAFTMSEVVGRDLGEQIAVLHQDGPDPIELRRAVGWLARASDAVAYAHSRGVVHRDLKPANIRIGPFGQVIVLDWGGALVLPASALQGVEALRRDGGVDLAGTPHFLAPEVAAGHPADLRTDVYGLGAVLYTLLGGDPPFAELPAAQVVQALRAHRTPTSLSSGLPFGLRQIVQRAMADDPRDRHQDAAAFSAALDAYLQGALRRDASQEKVQQVSVQVATRLQAEARAASLRAEAADLLGRIPPAAPAHRKAAGWAIEAEAEALELSCARGAVEEELALHVALNLDPHNADAHLALANRYLQTWEQARAGRERTTMAMAETRMRHHIDAVPRRNPGRQALLARFAPRRVRVDSETPAHAELFRFEERERRLVAEPVRDLGPTPVALELEPGAWQIVLRDEAGRTLRLPFQVGGREPFVAPGSERPVQHGLGLERPGDVVVPAGWFVCGGDPLADNPLPRAEVWLDAFAVDVFPVTNRQYLEFLDDLVRTGREDEALCHAPRERGGSPGVPGALVYGRHPDGRFYCTADADGDVWRPEEPVTLVDWFGAQAFATWRRERDGLPWRLPSELEWEKAARGPDERLFPWGDRFDPSWCCMRDSHVGKRSTPLNDDFPGDISPYGVRGLAGGVRDWSADAYLPEGQPVVDGRPIEPLAAAPHAERVERGGAWYGFERDSRAANRFAAHPSSRFHNIGFRLCRSLPMPQEGECA